MTDRTDDATPPPRSEPAGYAPSRRGLGEATLAVIPNDNLGIVPPGKA